MTEPAPPWKFWHPLPFWHAVLIAFVAQIVCMLPVVALREVLHIPLPEWIGSALGGAAMFIVIRHFARRRLAAESSNKP